MALCFMFPVLNGKYSGAFNVALSLAIVASKREIELKIIDYETGLLKKDLTSLGVDFDFIDLDASNYSDQVSADDIVFGFNNDIYSFPVIFKNNPRVFIYDVYYPFWKRFARPLGIKLPFEGKFLNSIAKSDFLQSGIAFMEAKGVNNLKNRFPSLSIDKVKIVPVSTQVPGWVKRVSVLRRTIRFTYIGRSEGWKLFPLVKFMEDLRQIRNSIHEDILFNIVVSDVRIAKEFISAAGLDASLYNFQFYENLVPQELGRVISAETDIGVAMGTSALEFAKFGTPCLLLDFSHRKIIGRVGYRWLYEAIEFNLGRDLSEVEKCDGNDLSEIIGDYLLNEAKIARKCYDYVYLNHNQDVNYVKLLDYVKNTEAKTSDIFVLYFVLINFFQNLRRNIRGRAKYERY